MKSWLILKHVLRVVKFNQKLWLKPYIDMNTNLRQRAKIIFRKIFSSWWIMQFLKKLLETDRRRNYLVSELNYHTTKFFTENLLAIEMKKTQILMNKPIYLVLSVLDLSKM